VLSVCTNLGDVAVIDAVRAVCQSIEAFKDLTAIDRSFVSTTANFPISDAPAMLPRQEKEMRLTPLRKQLSQPSHTHHKIHIHYKLSILQ
jgi:hypothetical protein